VLQSALIRPSIRRVSSFARRHSSALPTTCGRLSMGEAHLGVHGVGRASAVLAASPVVGRRARAWRSRCPRYGSCTCVEVEVMQRASPLVEQREHARQPPVHTVRMAAVSPARGNRGVEGRCACRFAGRMMLACGVWGCEAGMTRLLPISRKMRHCQASPRGGQPRHGRRLKDGFIARCSDRTSLTQQAGVFSSNVSGPPCQ